MEISNFRFEESKVDLNKVTELKWLNDGSVPDFLLELVDSIFSGFDEDEKKRIEESWGLLKNRAKSLIPSGSPFVFVNQSDLRWEGFKNDNPKTGTIEVSKGIEYKDTVAIRSNDELYLQMGLKKSPRAFVVVNILISSDNKIVLGKRKFYGDWPSDTYECPGAFLHESDLTTNSLMISCKAKIADDYKVTIKDIQSVPLAIYYLPRVLEMVLVCVSKTKLRVEELKSDFYEDVLAIDNTFEGLRKLMSSPLDQFHPPSRVALQVYCENFILASRLLKNVSLT